MHFDEIAHNWVSPEDFKLKNVVKAGDINPLDVNRDGYGELRYRRMSRKAAEASNWLKTKRFKEEAS